MNQDELQKQAAAHYRAGRLDEALASTQQALALAPDSARLLRLRGSLLHQMECFAEALQSFDAALEITSFSAEAWQGRGSALHALHRFDEAADSLRRALALDPKSPNARIALGSALLLAGQIGEGLVVFTDHAKTVYGGAAPPAEDHPTTRQRHDAEQKAYLADEGITAAFHLEEGARLAGPAVNPANRDAVTAEWQSRQPQVVVIDDFLTPEALEKLRRFCWGSTVWRRNFGEGYLGALLEHGFACPLIGQIAEELRDVFPAILGEHPLLYLWGFKYDSRHSGVKIHADSAAVNVNFWITEDDACLDAPASGLEVWDAAAPPDWDFDTYNADEKSIRDFLAAQGSKAMTIAYRANRAVVFDSDLFHQTGKIAFAEGYRNRRINVTLLYGWRGGKI